MIIMFLKMSSRVPWRGNAVGEDIVDSLDVEGFLDLGIGSDVEMEEHQSRDEEEEQQRDCYQR